jgi:hypothetical protein
MLLEIIDNNHFCQINHNKTASKQMPLKMATALANKSIFIFAFAAAIRG